MILGVALLITVCAVLFTLFVRDQDLPEAAPYNPFRHLDERKARIYENLRDLQFEYRVGKLSDEDYQSSKQSLQRELQQVLTEAEAVKTELEKQGLSVKQTVKQTGKPKPTVCPHCGATFKEALKFCGQCGKPIA